MGVVNQYATLESFDAKKLDVFIQLGKDLNEDVLSEMLNTYFQTTDSTIFSFKSSAVEKDFHTIAHLAHKLKSSSGQLGLNRIHKMCSDLENLIKSESAHLIEFQVNQLIKLIEEETVVTTNLLQDFLKAAA